MRILQRALLFEVGYFLIFDEGAFAIPERIGLLIVLVVIFVKHECFVYVFAEKIIVRVGALVE